MLERKGPRSGRRWPWVPGMDRLGDGLGKIPRRKSGAWGTRGLHGLHDGDEGEFVGGNERRASGLKPVPLGLAGNIR